MLFTQDYSRQSVVRTALVLFLILASSGAFSYAQELGPDAYEQFKFRHIGPIGNRTTSVVDIRVEN